MDTSGETAGRARVAPQPGPSGLWDMAQRTWRRPERARPIRRRPTGVSFIRGGRSPVGRQGETPRSLRFYHDATGVREAIEAVGASVLSLPPYSPELNPIEQT